MPSTRILRVLLSLWRLKVLSSGASPDVFFRDGFRAVSGRMALQALSETVDPAINGSARARCTSSRRTQGGPSGKSWAAKANSSSANSSSPGSDDVPDLPK